MPIGILAGIPTAVFLQVGFVQTLRQRGEAVRPSRLGGLLPAGLGYAIVRDCVYWAATQKQVQTPKPTWAEEMTCQVCVVGVPLICDTLSVRVVDPKFAWPKTFRATLAMACPPVALLGRTTWIPVYNWAYVVTQQQIGDKTPLRDVMGLVAGSLAASCVAYPLFVLKTNMLLLQGTEGSLSPTSVFRLIGRSLAHTVGAGDSLSKVPTISLTTLISNVFRGLKPHAIANIGPDVLCMAAARIIYSFCLTTTFFGATTTTPQETTTSDDDASLSR